MLHINRKELKRIMIQKNTLYTLLNTIVLHPELHLKWLNALSYMENCGARKIAQYEDRTEVSEEVLKHAAEEFRHAHFLRKQISKLALPVPDTYALSSLLGGLCTLRYLDSLDLFVSRLIQKEHPSLTLRQLRELAYLIVTYTIEKRAEAFYPIYQQVLKENKQRISMRVIIAEEEEHLNEMIKALEVYSFAPALVEQSVVFEEKVFNKFLKQVEKEVTYFSTTLESSSKAIASTLVEV